MLYKYKSTARQSLSKTFSCRTEHSVDHDRRERPGAQSTLSLVRTLLCSPLVREPQCVKEDQYMICKEKDKHHETDPAMHGVHFIKWKTARGVLKSYSRGVQSAAGSSASFERQLDETSPNRRHQQRQWACRQKYSCTETQKPKETIETKEEGLEALCQSMSMLANWLVRCGRARGPGPLPRYQSLY